MLGAEAWNNAAVVGALANYLREGPAICAQTCTTLSGLETSLSYAQYAYFLKSGK